MRKILIGLVASLIILSCFSGCNKNRKQDITNPIIREYKDYTIGNSINQFNWNLFDQMDASKSFFYSGYSIAAAFAMLDVGASGNTKTEIESALYIEDVKAFGKELADITQSFENQLVMGNSIWLQKGYSLSNDFSLEVKPVLQDCFSAEVFEVDFAKNLKNVHSQIQKWVQKNTADIIDDYKSISNENTLCDIVNAIGFTGQWTKKFLKDDTYKDEFTKANGQIENVDMMHTYMEKYGYYSDDNLKMLAIDYDNGAEMIVIMSCDESKNVLDALSQYENKNLMYSQMIDNLSSTKISRLSLPKFTNNTILNGDQFKEILMNAGIQEAFSPYADFDKISSDLYVYNVQHQAKVIVDEQGTKAAAVTEIIMKDNALPIQEDQAIAFDVNRPFVFVIRDTISGAILFTGYMSEIE